VNSGFDAECAECIEGNCFAAQPPFLPCNNSEGYCASGVCETCLDLGAPCQSPNQCCSGNCDGFSCTGP
jgi:hypothetical protein